MPGDLVNGRAVRRLASTVYGKVKPVPFHPQGEMLPAFVLKPRELDFDLVAGEPRTKQLEVSRNFGGGLEVGRPEDLPSWLELSLPGRPVGAPGIY